MKRSAMASEVASVIADKPLMRLWWRLLFASDALLGVRRARELVSSQLRVGARLSEASYWKTANRVSARLRLANPALVKVPARWASDTPVVRVRRLGLDMELDLRDNLQAVVFYTGDYEPRFTRHLHAEIRAGDTYADVGAHIGVHALRVARRLARSGGRVLAFEPTPDSAQKLNEAAVRNQLDIQVIPLALSSHPGELSLYADDRYDSHDAGVRSAHGAGRHVATVPAAPFDDWAERQRLDRLDVVKIDVEGHEAAVLDGMRRSLARLRPRALYVEVKANSTGRGMVSDGDLRALVDSLGYQSTEESYDHNELFRPRSG
jgi:FkbM family methyltransferase